MYKEIEYRLIDYAIEFRESEFLKSEKIFNSALDLVKGIDFSLEYIDSKSSSLSFLEARFHTSSENNMNILKKWQESTFSQAIINYNNNIPNSSGHYLSFAGEPMMFYAIETKNYSNFKKAVFLEELALQKYIDDDFGLGYSHFNIGKYLNASLIINPGNFYNPIIKKDIYNEILSQNKEAVNHLRFHVLKNSDDIVGRDIYFESLLNLGITGLNYYLEFREDVKLGYAFKCNRELETLMNDEKFKTSHRLNNKYVNFLKKFQNVKL